MNKLLAAIAAIGTGIMGMAGGLNYARAFPVQIPISGLPSVTVNSNATLIAGQPTSLGDLITYNPGVNTQCQFVDYPNGGVTGTGPCSISYSILEIYPNPAYTISGAYINPLGEITGVAGGIDPFVPAPDYTSIALTANPGVPGSVSIAGFINPQTTTWSYGPIGWGGTVQVGVTPPPPPPLCAAIGICKSLTTQAVLGSLATTISAMGTLFSLAGLAYDPALAVTELPLAWTTALLSGASLLSTGGNLPISGQDLTLLSADLNLANIVISSAICPVCAELTLTGLALNAVGTAIGAFAVDPPDPNYKQLPSIGISNLSPSLLTADQLAAMGIYSAGTVSLLNSLSDVQQAALLALSYLQKGEGAEAANDLQYEALYSQLYNEEISALAVDFSSFQSALDSVLGLVMSDPANNFSLGLPESLIEMIKADAGTGIPLNITQALAELGLGGILKDSQLQELISQAADLSPTLSLFGAVDTEDSTINADISAFLTQNSSSAVPEPQMIWLLLPGCLLLICLLRAPSRRRRGRPCAAGAGGPSRDRS